MSGATINLLSNQIQSVVYIQGLSEAERTWFGLLIEIGEGVRDWPVSPVSELIHSKLVIYIPPLIRYDWYLT